MAPAALFCAPLACAQVAAPLPVKVDIDAQGTAATGARTAENAVRSAADAFGTTVGRETIGLYSPENARGFSPTAAGNVRIEGLYFDQVWELGARLQRTTQIRVGLSALGSPFPAPTGIVDYAFRTPTDERAVSVLGELNQWGNNSFEVDANLPLQPGLSLGLGGAIFNDRNYNSTRARFIEFSAALRWEPAPGLELVPFATHADGYEIKGPIFLPASEELPPPLPRRFFKGPDWARYSGSVTNGGLLATWRLAAGWELKGGLFHSRTDDRTGATNLIVDLDATGRGAQIVIVDPPLTFASTSGELRLTRTISDGPRAHRIHVSLRGRAGNRRFGGSDVIDLGPTSIHEPTTAPRPAIRFSAQQRDRVRQWTAGLAYEGRWEGVGELSAGLQKTRYRKRIGLPGEPPVVTDAAPLLFNVAFAAELSRRLVAYGGYVTGLEESGIAPDNAANRNEALPAIRTSQRDAGLRYALTDEIKLVAGVFDVRKPYFNLDGNGRFDALGDVINQGAEISLAGLVTQRLSVVAGAVLLHPRVTGAGVASGEIGRRPVAAIGRRIELNADWRPPWLEGLSLDIKVAHRGTQIATVSNLTTIPPRTRFDLGGRYQFAMAGKASTLRLQIENLTDIQGVRLEGAGAYDFIPGRRLGGYLTVDF